MDIIEFVSWSVRTTDARWYEEMFPATAATRYTCGLCGASVLMSLIRIHEEFHARLGH